MVVIINLNWVYFDVSQICIELLGHIGAQAGCWRLLFFVTYDLVPRKFVFIHLEYIDGWLGKKPFSDVVNFQSHPRQSPAFQEIDK